LANSSHFEAQADVPRIHRATDEATERLKGTAYMADTAFFSKQKKIVLLLNKK